MQSPSRLRAFLLLAFCLSFLITVPAAAKRRDEAKPVGFGTLVGRVVWPEDGISTLMAFPKHGSRVEIVTAMDGSFRLEHVPAGPLRIKVMGILFGGSIALDVRPDAVDSVLIQIETMESLAREFAQIEASKPRGPHCPDHPHDPLLRGSGCIVSLHCSICGRPAVCPSPCNP